MIVLNKLQAASKEDEARGLLGLECIKRGEKLLDICVAFLQAKTRQYETEKRVLAIIRTVCNFGPWFIHEFERAGGVDALIESQFSEQPEVYNTVSKLLETYFSAELV